MRKFKVEIRLAGAGATPAAAGWRAPVGRLA